MLNFIDNIRYSEVRKDFKGEEYIIISFYRYTDDSEDDILEIGMPKKRVVRSFGNFSEEEKDLIFKEVESLYANFTISKDFIFKKSTDKNQTYNNIYNGVMHRLILSGNSQVSYSENYLKDFLGNEYILVHYESQNGKIYRDIKYPYKTCISKSKHIDRTLKKLIKCASSMLDYLPDLINFWKREKEIMTD